VPLLAGLSDSDLHKLESVCEIHAYSPGQLLFQSGDAGDFAVVVLSGELVIHLNPADGHTSSFGGDKLTSQRLLQPGEHLGAQTLLVSRPRAFSLVSSHASSVALLHRSSLMGAIGPLDNHIMKDRDLYSKFAPLLHHRHI
jgi:CRP-like cAMP-binding protein